MRRLASLVVAAVGVFATATPATAAVPRPEPTGWLVTESSGSTPTPDNTPPQTSTALPAALPQDDVKRICRSQHAAQASTQQGWMMDRFNRCHIGHRKVELRCRGCSTSIASVEFDYTLVGIAQNGTRQVDFYLSFDDWKALGGAERETTPMRVSLTGCGSLITCNPSGAEVSQPLGQWAAIPNMWVTMTSPNNTGIGNDYRAQALVRLNMAITPVNPQIDPWIENGMTTADIRFDSAGAVVGRHHGAVFSDVIPTYDLAAIARADNGESRVEESIQHIDDALHHPVRTWPSFLGKSPPGEYRPEAGANQRPLHRLVDSQLQATNREWAGRVCRDVWGEGSATPNLNCDEYPMASTREGAYTGSGGADGNPDGWKTWHGSARLISEIDNQESGQRYLNIGFYQPQRIIDGDAFFVAISR
ncbi:hypothetical protein [Verrucosispora sp. WMMD573]|uniref:NucA/NucB deoxyribonuclease domain-containing protein n=1 Tax=Verrucosispora sp. WMMD573 TaxID=3015149 RepID=UPI00248B82B2|nr:hypothetical protein [Verrucosispora sp. WMMD573]WBB52375.1 hypothetical protein O7601_17440 [Verrucosispora sp. WMMD573]